jgi:outer membrane protein assembly factor BamA
VVLLVEARQKAKIAKILFSGNAVVAGNLLLQQTDLREGGEFEPELVKMAVQKIALFYSKQGYLASDVKFQFDEKSHELKFLISEGEPTLLSSVSISPMTSVERKDLRTRYEREILAAFALSSGDRIQRDKVLDGIQAIKDWLREHDFLMARDPGMEYKVAEDGKVSIFLNIAYGQRIRYGFRGNKQFSYRELLALVSEVKEVSSGSDYLSSVRRRVLEAYKEIGFANARITTLVREDPMRGIQYVSLVVNEGQKIRVEKLEVEGVFSMSKEEAEKKLKSLGTRLVQRGYFDEQGINRAAELFAEQLRASGYLSAKLEFIKPDYNPDHTKVKVSALFHEGIQTKLASVEIQGVKSFQPSEVKQLLGLKEGEPFNIFAFESGLQTLKDRYQEFGNLSAQITNEASGSIVRYSKDNSEVYIRLEVDEGPIFKVGEILVRGNKKTHARVLLRELPFISGDLLTSPLLNEAEV